MRLKEDEFTSFVFEISINKILVEFDNSYEVLSENPRHNSGLNDIVYGLLAKEHYYILYSTPFIIKKYNQDHNLVSTYSLENDEVKYFEKDGFILPEIANIGFSYNAFFDVFYTVSYSPITKENVLYLYDSNFKEIITKVDLSKFWHSEDDIYQNTSTSTDSKGNIYLTSNSKMGPHILRIELSKI